MMHFKTEKVTDRVTRIYAFASELMYLVEGEQRAVLLDTGSGIGSLKDCVSGLTDKPVTVLITHGHVDHAMGAIEFDEVYLSHLDEYIYRPHADTAFRREGLAEITRDPACEEGDFLLAAPFEKFRDLKGGDTFDLGGLHIDVYDCPGHTKGSVVMLLREERALLLGDACNSFTFLFDTYSDTVCEYEESLRRLLSQVQGKYDSVYLSHGSGCGHKEMIEDVIRVCEDIRAGRTDDVFFPFRDTSGLIAKAVDENGQRLDGGRGNIVYSRSKIYPAL